MLDNLKILRDTTWAALCSYDLDPTDKDSVIRFEKLSKLLLSVNRQITQLEAVADPEPIDLMI